MCSTVGASSPVRDRGADFPIVCSREHDGSIRKEGAGSVGLRIAPVRGGSEGLSITSLDQKGTRNGN